MYSKQNIINVAKDLAFKKAEALRLLAADSFDEEFAEAVSLILNCNGKIIISGIGKSGHIGAKIASTLSSILIPAIFLHPAEASHGDMGVITKEDILIVLSNGGESQEIYDLLNYSRDNKNKIIAIVGNKNSTLYNKSDVRIVIPNIGEGTKIKAPMISTSMMLTCGDAIAAAIISEKKISDDDFKKTHPGGKIGATLLKVKDVMRTGSKIPVVTPDQLMSEALLEITQKSIGCTAVLEDGKFIGVITDGDIRRHMSKMIAELKVEQVMTKSPFSASAETYVVEALKMMNQKKITSLFIVDSQGALKGVIHMHDCIMLGLKQIDSEE